MVNDNDRGTGADRLPSPFSLAEFFPGCIAARLELPPAPSRERSRFDAHRQQTARLDAPVSGGMAAAAHTRGHRCPGTGLKRRRQGGRAARRAPGPSQRPHRHCDRKRARQPAQPHRRRCSCCRSTTVCCRAAAFQLWSDWRCSCWCCSRFRACSTCCAGASCSASGAGSTKGCRHAFSSSSCGRRCKAAPPRKVSSRSATWTMCDRSCRARA